MCVCDLERFVGNRVEKSGLWKIGQNEKKKPKKQKEKKKKKCWLGYEREKALQENKDVGKERKKDGVGRVEKKR